MKEKIAKLVDLKTLVTLSLTATFIMLCIQGKVEADTFMIVFMTVLAFYFTKKKEGV